MGRRFRFGDHRFDAASGELEGAAGASFLRPQAARVLELLLESAGEMVTREQLESALWPAGNPAADECINACIRQLRQALDDDARQPRYIETVPRRGYRMIAAVIDNPADAVGDTAEGAARGRRATRRLALALVGALFVVAAVLLARDTEPRPVGFAVLPFTHLDGDERSESYAAVLTEDLTTALGQLEPRRVRVVGSREALRFRDAELPLYVIGDQLGVHYLVQGTVRRSNERMLITVQLIGVNDRTQRWSGTFDGAPGPPHRLPGGLTPVVSEAVLGAAAAER